MSEALIFSCLKNEGAFLLEWLAYHRVIGFDAAMLFTNDCSDGTDRLADALAAAGVVQHVRNDGEDARGPQWRAMRAPALRKALASAPWAMHLDVDEFLNIRVGGGRLPDLVAALGDAQAISLPWRFFGNAGLARYEDRPVCRQFTYCGPYPVMFPRQALMFKTLFRPGAAFARPGIHAPRPRGPMPDWRQGDGRPVGPDFRPDRPLLVGTDAGNSLAQVNHYALRSKESFLVKASRGLPNRRNVAIDLDYWVMRNFNALEDRTMLRWAAALDAEIARLKALPGVAEAHEAACDWHRAEARRLMETVEGITLYAGLSVAGNTQVPTPMETDRIYRGLAAVHGPA